MIKLARIRNIIAVVRFIIILYYNVLFIVFVPQNILQRYNLFLNYANIPGISNLYMLKNSFIVKFNFIGGGIYSLVMSGL